MAVNRISRSFKDISLSFDPHPVTGDLPIIKNEVAIKRSIKNIVQTNLTEKFFNSSFGSNVRSNLFEFFDVATAATIQKQIELSIQNYEPRVNNVIVEVDPNIDSYEFNVTITFNIIGQELPTQQFSFILEATR
jgi:phage baseplate assembly protein W